MTEKANVVRSVFGIPLWYKINQVEEDRLLNYIKNATTYDEARTHRLLDCSAFCPVEGCYFCSEEEKRMLLNPENFEQRDYFC